MSSNYRLVFLPKAVSDLDSIYAYIAGELKNVKAASDLADKFEKAFDLLMQFPLSCPVAKTEPSYRKLLVDNYIAFYKVSEGTVTVFRVLYGMMNFDKYL